MAFKFEVQTRDADGRLNFFPTLREALVYAQTTPSVWKISFPLETEERCRLVRSENGPFILDQMEDHLKEAMHGTSRS